MKEVKYRGISKDSKKWIYGSLMLHKPFTEIKYYIKPSIIGNPIVWEEVIKETVGQFTGIKGSAGKEVYDDGVKAKVIFKNGRFEGYNGESSNSIDAVTDLFDDSPPFMGGFTYEVIGNIYENKGLL